MAVVGLRVTPELLSNWLRLDRVHGQVVGARMVAEEGLYPIVVFDIETPDAPEGATGMSPTYRIDSETGPIAMEDPGWEVAPGG